MKTRIEIKSIPMLFSLPMVQAILMGRKTVTRRLQGLKHLRGDKPDLADVEEVYRFGDEIWVREKFWTHPGQRPRFDADLNFTQRACVVNDEWKCHPSIHMPRAICRLRLRIKEASLERLHNISTAETQLEGLPGIGEFAALWNGLHKADGFSWARNPWVWRIEFEVERSRP